jgi:hypothetical protein
VLKGGMGALYFSVLKKSGVGSSQLLIYKIVKCLSELVQLVELMLQISYLQA